MLNFENVKKLINLENVINLINFENVNNFTNFENVRKLINFENPVLGRFDDIKILHESAKVDCWLKSGWSLFFMTS